MGAHIDGPCRVCRQHTLQRPHGAWMDGRLVICAECQVVSGG